MKCCRNAPRDSGIGPWSLSNLLDGRGGGGSQPLPRFPRGGWAGSPVVPSSEPLAELYAPSLRWLCWVPTSPLSPSVSCSHADYHDLRWSVGFITCALGPEFTTRTLTAQLCRRKSPSQHLGTSPSPIPDLSGATLALCAVEDSLQAFCESAAGLQ